MITIRQKDITVPSSDRAAYRLFDVYRLMLIALLLFAFFLGVDLTIHNNQLLRVLYGTGFVYAAFLFCCVFVFPSDRMLPGARTIQATIDISFIVLLCFLSGYDKSSLTLLLLFTLLAYGSLLPRHYAITVGMYGSTSLVLMWVARQFFALKGDQLDWNGLVYIVALSGLLLGLMGLVHGFAERARRNEAIANAQAIALEEAAEIHRAIIEDTNAGILVIDAQLRILMMNQTACRWLGVDKTAESQSLWWVSEPLNQRLSQWLSAGIINSEIFVGHDESIQLIAHFSNLEGNFANHIVIHLEDAIQTDQRAQEIKLAALGQLTAGIAHEIRNPLNSISQAAQLLREQAGDNPMTLRLTTMITENAQRMNRIISTVLDTARKEKLQPQIFFLQHWLPKFRDEFLMHADQELITQRPEITVTLPDQCPPIAMDPAHLHQIVWNLCVNACQHTLPVDDEVLHLFLRAGVIGHQVWLEVMDNGSGVAVDKRQKMFEPFFSTHHKGTGLGLYLTRELCQLNGARLSYRDVPDAGACFRITFSARDHAPQSFNSEENLWMLQKP